MKIAFTVPGQPIAKARTRNVPRKKCRKCGKFTFMKYCWCGSDDFEFAGTKEFTPTPTVRYENQVKAFGYNAMISAGIAQPLVGAIQLSVQFFFPPAKTRAKKIKENDPHTQTPDGTNCLKSIEDGLRGTLYGDDSQLWRITVEKMWTHNIPRAEIEVSNEG